MGCSRPRSQLTSRFAVRCSRFISFSCPIYESGKHSSADQHGTEAANFPSPTNLANNETAAQNDLIVPTDKELAFIGSVLKKLNKPSGSALDSSLRIRFAAILIIMSSRREGSTYQ